MPPPPLRRVLEDSDDDGDGVSLEPEIPATKSQPCGRQEGPAANIDTESVEERTFKPGLDGTDEQQSITSTERLRKEIRSAERHLVRDSGETKSSDSSAGKASKRRHTEVRGPGIGGSMTSSERSVKRIKTLKTYGSKHRSALALPDDEGDFSRLRDNERRLSGGGGLVDGPLGRGFIEHEPRQMFDDSGSTAVYGTASQERMLEAARGRADGGGFGMMTLPVSDPERSSSFPWSPSVQTQGRLQVWGEAELGAGGGTGDAELATGGGMGDVHVADDVDGAGPANVATHVDDSHADAASKFSSPRGAVRQSGTQPQDPEFALLQEPSRQVTDLNHAPQTPGLRSSPRVEIPVSTTISAQKTTKARKRKLSDGPTELLNSEEVAIGLPKECYVPRLSRRRTQAAEEPIDYSVRPEKAAKIKRNKTTAIAKSSPSQQSRPSTNPATDTSTKVVKQSEGVAGLETPRSLRKNHVVTSEDLGVTPETGQAWSMINKWLKSPEGQQNDPKGVPSLHACVEDHQPLQPPRCEPAISPPAENVGVEASDTAKAQAGDDIVVKPAQRQDKGLLTAPPKQDDEMFIKPAPKQKTTASKAKAKRRATTIFEDHVHL
ncbi:DNA binding domain with preference for A/T rich regions, partial [Teratosphaeria destructans]